MELIAIVLSGLFSVFANGGWVIDAIAASSLSDQVVSVEEKAIRIDNTPNYQIAQGKVDKLRIATRGVKLTPYLRIDTLELETDAIAVELNNLDTQNLKSLRSSLLKPLQGVGKIIITEADISQALQAPEVTQQLQEVLNNLVARRAGNSSIGYEISAPELELHPNNKVKIHLELRRLGNNRKNASKLSISLEFNIQVLEGKKIQLMQPIGTVNNRPMSSRLLQGFAEGMSDRLDLSQLESQGILARLLQLEITADKIELVAFARMETKQTPINSTKPVKP
ncbi:MAG: DUF2993 domain-containing protein [Xenococcaceae cyanobacterium MO_207.B15]|nr:DUF2993 domain-containing protein [Xenococcaceae cyanobacterium MO_207.B15]MDJ0745198.1 DUF2993 domain-containing protein [Xenococcaceae cyanobacterium MO_167.B27]